MPDETTADTDRTRVRHRQTRGASVGDGDDVRSGRPPRRRRGRASDPFTVQDDGRDTSTEEVEERRGGDDRDASDRRPDGPADTPDSSDAGEDGAPGARGDEVAATDDARPRRRRRRGRRGGRGGQGGDGATTDATDASDSVGPGEAETETEAVETDAADDVADDDAAEDGAAEDGAAEDGAAADAPDAQSEEDAGAAGDDAAAASDDRGGSQGQANRKRRRRGRRGRGRRGRPAHSTEETVTVTDAEAGASAPTRLSARSKSGSGRRRVPTVSAETRRAIAESPPKRMLVTVGSERTQIAVLEERNLVEHYVTDSSEQSYVGNIYRGRVQNVLPGMEAAFVDIGKGRNGVLYAGEVNYDEADREGGPPRIEQALKPGQSVLVQVTKDPMGTKGARLTQHLSLAGRYCVLAPGDDMLGISRKLPDDQRDRLRKILKNIKPDGFGLIVRTAAESATAEQLEADVERLMARWEKVTDKADKAKPLDCVYSEPQLVLRVIRDVFGPEHTQLIIDDEELADQVRDYLREVSPEHVDKVVTYRGDGRLFDSYEVTTQIRRALERKVWLKSGGYLIIEKTEAMWVIDVNTGKFVGKDNLEETVLRNNIEAAVEIARQLRLRDMGGIIVIDFVDMIVPANREEVLKRFRRELARDKTKSRVMEISKLGLVQMTRKNVSKGLMESFTEPTDDAIPGRRIVEDLLA